MRYTVVYGGNSTHGYDFESDSRNALKHLMDCFEASGNDCISVYLTSQYNKDMDDYGHIVSEPLSSARYTPESGGSFYRC